MLSSSELLCNRMTQRDTERVGAFFVAFNGYTNVSCCGNLSMKKGDVQRQCYLELQDIYILLVLLELAVCGLCFSVCD
jgi:hypothetical protein